MFHYLNIIIVLKLRFNKVIHFFLNLEYYKIMFKYNHNNHINIYSKIKSNNNKISIIWHSLEFHIKDNLLKLEWFKVKQFLETLWWETDLNTIFYYLIEFFIIQIIMNSTLVYL